MASLTQTKDHGALIARLRTVRSRMYEAERNIDSEHFDRQSNAYHIEAQQWRGEYNDLCAALGIVTIHDERAVLGGHGGE